MGRPIKGLLEGLELRKNIFTALGLQLLLVMALLSICRIGFYLFNLNFFPEMSLGHFLQLMLGGLRFDLVTTLYCNALFILLTIVPVDLRFHEKYRIALKYGFFFTNGIMLAVNVADFIYYKFTLRRTTADVFRQFENETNVASLWLRFLWDYWCAALFWLLLIVVMIVVYNGINVRGPQLKNRRMYYITGSIVAPLIAFLVWGGMRGGFRHSTRPITLSNAGAYVKDPRDISIVLNTPFAIFRTWGKTNLQKVNFYSDTEVDKVYSPVHYPNDSTNFRPDNVVIIILESFSKEFFGAFNKERPGYHGYTPFLDSLNQHSASFTYSYANGRKSIDGLPSVVASIPSLGVPYFLSPYSGNKINSIASLLKEKKYHTSFFHGAPNGSMGFQAFMNMAGVDEYYGMTEYDDDDDFDGIWGIWDDKFLQYFADKLDEFPQPFTSTLFSVSSHHPFEIPDRLKDRFKGGPLVIHKCIEYTDYALAEFFRKASKTIWYRNTLFVITADHTSSEIQFPEGRTGWGFYSVPLIFFKPDNSLAGERKEIAQQIDIMPSVLEFLNFDRPYVAFGRDLFNGNGSPFAINYKDNVYQYFEGDYLLQFDGTRSVGLYNIKLDKLMLRDVLGEFPQVAGQMEQKVKALIQQYNNRMLADKLTVE
ncbi:MAG TPA: LTA synthase family protein [Chryseolinea sp.]|nr:LTA synthase family protein [Chryseolinea sp.]